MRGRRYLMLLMAAVLVWWAVRLAPSALALASATVNFGGTLQAGQGTLFLTCTAPANLSPYALVGQNQDRGTLLLTCTNKLQIAVNVTVAMGTLTPSGGASPPVRAWTRTTIPLGAGATATATLNVDVSDVTTTGTYLQRFTTTITASNGLDYAKDHTVNFRVDP